MRIANVIFTRPEILLCMVCTCTLANVEPSVSPTESCSASDDEPLTTPGENCLLQQDPGMIARYRRFSSLEEEHDDQEHPALESTGSTSNGPERVSLTVDGHGTSDSVSGRHDVHASTSGENASSSMSHQRVKTAPIKARAVQAVQDDVVDDTLEMLDAEKLAIGLAGTPLDQWTVQTPAPTPPAVSTLTPSAVSTLAHSAVQGRTNGIESLQKHGNELSGPSRYGASEIESLWKHDIELSRLPRNDMNLKPWKKAVELANAPWNQAVLALAGSALAAAPSAAQGATAPSQAPAASAKTPASAAKESPGEAPKAAMAPAGNAKEAPTEAPKAAKSPASGANETPTEAPKLAKAPAKNAPTEAPKATTAAAKGASAQAAVNAKEAPLNAAKAPASSIKEVTTAAPVSNGTGSIDLVPLGTTTSPPESNATNESAMGSVLKWLAGAPTPPSAPAPTMAPASAPNPHLIKQLARGNVPVIADQHYTQHGCHCLLEWQHEGKAMRGCSKTDDHDTSWCKVAPGCDNPAGEAQNAAWDVCFLPSVVGHLLTQNGCHCAPEFYHKGQLWKGCSRTSLGPTWCHLYESGALCQGAHRSDHFEQDWDYCHVAEQSSPILTRDGCHCMTEWVREGKHYHGCVEPILGPDRKFPWCYVQEDESSCPIAQKDEYGRLWDACWLLSDQDLAMLDSTVNSCHCEPEWEHNGVTMKGCSKTPDRPRPWCYVIEDARLCKKVAGTGEGKERLERWDWCDNSDYKPDLVPKNHVRMPWYNHQRQRPSSEAHEDVNDDSLFPGLDNDENLENTEDTEDVHYRDVPEKEAHDSHIFSKLTWYATGFFALIAGVMLYVCCCRTR